MTQRLPTPGADDNIWGDVLNGFLQVEHNTDGTLKIRTDDTVAPLSGGKVPATNLGSGTASSSTFLSGDGTWAALDESDVTNLVADLAATEKSANKGAASGYAPLNGASKVPVANLPTGTTAGTVAAGDDPRFTAAATTKLIAATFGSPNSGQSNGTPVAIGTNTVNSRALQMLPQQPVRYRFKLSNASAQNSFNPGTPIQIDSLWIGAPAYTDAAHNNKWLGDMTATPTQVYTGPGTLATSGTTDLTTPWITNAGEITPRTPFVLSVGLTASAGGSGIMMSDIYGGMQFGATSTTQAGVAVPVAGYNYAGFPLDIRMEYEVLATAKDLVAFVIGASGESGYSGSGDLSSSARALNDAVDAWPSVWASQQGYHVTNAGLFGSATTDWTSGSGRPYTRFDLATTVPDIAIIGSQASNDINLGTSVSTIVSNYYTIVANLKALGIKRIFGLTIPPRNLAGANETNRIAFNAFMRAIPDGLEDVFDVDLALRDPTARASLLSDLVSADTVHPVRAGYRVMASEVRIGA